MIIIPTTQEAEVKQAQAHVWLSKIKVNIVKLVASWLEIKFKEVIKVKGSLKSGALITQNFYSYKRKRHQ